MVYIEESHATDGWELSINEEEDVMYEYPTTLLERQTVAQSCVADLGLEIPTLVDELDNRTEIAYTAWPERLYLIGSDGRVVFKSRPGPFGFDPDELSNELQKLYSESEKQSPVR